MKNIRKTYPALYRFLMGAVIGAVVSAVVLSAHLGGLLTSLENKTGDVRFRIFSDPKRHDDRIVIITLDEESLNFYRNDLGTWPWPREVFGALLDYLKAGGARLVAFDLIFAEPDIKNPTSDAAFARAASGFGKAITSTVFLPGPETGTETYEALMEHLYLAEHFSVPVENRSDITLSQYRSATLPYLGLLAASSGTGCINFVADPDGPSRAVYPLFLYQGRYYPSLCLISALKYLGVDPKKESIVITKNRTLLAGPITIPLSPDGRMAVNWHGPYRTYEYYSIGDIIESMAALRRGQPPRIPAETFAGRIVLVGTTAVSLFDLRATPFSPVYPGVELNATALDNILNNDHVKSLPRAEGVAVIVILSLLVAAVSLRASSAAYGILSLFVILIVFTLIVGYLFRWERVMMDYIAPTSAIFLSFVSTLVFNYVTEGRTKKKFKEAFAKYVSHQVAEEISKNIEDLKLDSGERRDISILFSDIRGFTSMSEKLPPEEVVRRLNIYFKAMVEVVFRFDGTLDKYVGDAIMAFFGAPKQAPDHARKACLCALSMKQELKKVNERLMTEGIPPMQIGIGINSGEVVVGNIGSERRMDYTVIGDSVNLASRLEGLNKEFGTTIIISEFTLKKAGDFVTRDLGQVNVKGKEQAVGIYELLGTGGAEDEAALR